jgi:hypothetical protein
MLAALLALTGLCGCLGTRPLAAPAPTAATKADKKSVDLAARNNAMALLNDLLGDEKNVSKILIIKFESREVNQLIKDISAASADGAKLLEATAKSDPGIVLTNLALPPGERAVRKAIAKHKQSLLLRAGTAEFEFEILIAQVEALGYGAPLALVVAENEPRAAQAREFSDLSVRLNQLYERVLGLLRAKK